MVIWAGWLLVGQQWVWPHNGGQGTDLPWNLLAWASMGLTAGAVWLTRENHPLHVPAGVWGLLVGGVLMSLPILWSPEVDWQRNATPRLLGLWGALALYVTLLQCHWRPGDPRWILGTLALAGLLQAAWVLVTLFAPDRLPAMARQALAESGGYSIGGFQQPNVTASFLATALLATLGLWVTRRPTDRPSTSGQTTHALLALSLLGPACAVILLRSRIGWLGVAIGVLALLALCRLPRYRRAPLPGAVATGVVLIVMGAGLGMLLLYAGLGSSLEAALQGHARSNAQRLLTLQETLRMIAEHPWRGWGLGGFEYCFQHAVADRGLPSREVMQHPHNEVLYVWAEGGVVALLGLLVMVGAALRLSGQRRGLSAWLLRLTALPILLHTQVELPLYLSVTHGWILVMLLVLLSPRPPAEKRHPPAGRVHLRRGGHAGLAAGALALTTIMLVSARNAMVLSRFEREQLPTPQCILRLPMTALLDLRYRQDVNLLRLIDFRTAPDPALLRAFVKDNTRWLQTRVDAGAYANQIAVLRYLGETQTADRWQREAQRLLPWERQFWEKE